MGLAKQESGEEFEVIRLDPMILALKQGETQFQQG